MRCVKFYDIISAYVDSEAAPLEQIALQEHLRTCDKCRNELSAQYALRDMLKQCCASTEHNINISSSVMSKITNKQSLDSIIACDNIMAYAVECDAPSASIKESVNFKLIAAVLMCAITVAAVFSVSRMSSQVAVADTVTPEYYTNYVYEHLNNTVMEEDYSDLPLSQVSFIK